MHVRHRDDRNAADLKAALRAAEAAVKEKLGYTIALTEKPLFDSSAIPTRTTEATVGAAHTATDHEEVCDSGDEGLTEERGRRMYERNEGPPSPHPENDAVRRGYDEAAAAARAAGAMASSSKQGPATVCGNKRSLSEINDNDTELDAVMAEAERRS